MTEGSLFKQIGLEQLDIQKPKEINYTLNLIPCVNWKQIVTYM